MPAPTADNELLDLNTLPESDAHTIDPESSTALDALLEEATGEKPPAHEEILPAEIPKPDEKPPEPPVETPVVSPEAEKPAAETPAPAKDTFDDVPLPPYTKPKTSEAFATIKLLAREKIASVEKERDELRTKIADLEAKAQPGLDPAVEKELTELRSFRERLDVEAHPSFKTWDEQVSKNVESIYVKLRAADVNEEAIKKIKDLGGPSEVDWEPLADRIPASTRRYIEGKLFENEDLSEKKRQAMEDAKKNAGEFLKTRSEEFQITDSKFAETARKEYESLTPQLTWMKDATPDAKATAEEKAAAAAHNKFVKETKATVEAVLSDNTPETRAVLAVGYAQLQKVRADHVALVRASTAISIAHKTEVDTLKSQIAEKDAFISKIKKSSHFPTSSSPAPGDIKKAKVDINETAQDALDRHLQELQAGRD